MPRTFFTCVCVLLSCLTVSTALAQRLTLTGTVRYAKDSTAVEGASIRLFNSQDTLIAQTSSDAEGAFRLESDSPNDAERLEIAYVGFMLVSIQASRWQGNVQIGNVYMVEDSKEMDAVMVTGSSRRINRQLVFPDAQQLKASPDVMTLLENLALTGLSVNPVSRSATIYGKPIQWKIDGVPASLERVKAIKPSAILRIDYTNVPSTRELDRGVGGIVNVILKEKNDGGTIFAHVQSALWVGFVNANASIDYHQGKSDFTLSYSANYRNYPKWQRSREQLFIAGSDTISHVQAPLNSPFEMLDQNLSLFYAYKPNSSNLFSATWNNYFGQQSLDIRNDISQTGMNDFFRTSKSQYNNYSPSLDLFYQHSFENGGQLETNLFGYLWMGKYQRDLEDRANGKTIATYSNPTSSRYYSLIGEISYEQPLHEKVYMVVGLQHKYVLTSNEYLSEGRYLDRMNENNSYLYAELSGRITTTLQYQVGTGAKFFYVKKGENDKLYIKNPSSLSLVYNPINGLTLALNSAITPSLPTLGQLSAVRERYDELSVHTGNSELKPSYRVNSRLNLRYRKDKFDTNLSLTYFYTHAPMYTRVTYLPLENYFLFQPDNGKFNHRYGAEWKANFRRLYDFFSLYATIGFNRYESNVGTANHHLNTLYGDISAQFFYKDFTLGMYYNYTADELYNETISGTGNTAVIALMWSNYGWTIYTNVIYVGHKDGDKYITTSLSPVNPSKSVVKIPENGNMLTLGVAWDFNFGKPKKSINRRLYNSDSNQSVVRVQE